MTRHDGSLMIRWLVLFPCIGYAESAEQSTYYDPTTSLSFTSVILMIILILIGLACIYCNKHSGKKKQEYVWQGKETDWKFV